MTTIRKHFITETVLGDGNCAYNAFIVALTRPQIFEQIKDELEEHFIIDAACFFHKDGYRFIDDPKILREQVIKTIQALRDENPKKLQQLLAPLFRNIAIQIASTNKKYQKMIEELFLSTIDIYGRTKDLNEDIFKYHYHILNKIYKVCVGKQNEAKEQAILFLHHYSPWAKPTLREMIYEACKLKSEEEMDKIKEELLNWWRVGDVDDVAGQQLFIMMMNQPGVWSGDLELAILAAYFRVNLCVNKSGLTKPLDLHFANGSLKDCKDLVLDEGQLNQLQLREIINNSEEQFFYPLSKEDLIQRVSALPDEVIQNLRGFVLCHELKNITDETILAELQRRNLINKKQIPTFDPADHESFLARMEAIKDKDQIIQAWETHHKDRPTLYLANDLGIHWNSVYEGTLSKEEDQPSPQLSPQNTLQKNYKYKKAVISVKEVPWTGNETIDNFDEAFQRSCKLNNDEVNCNHPLKKDGHKKKNRFKSFSNKVSNFFKQRHSHATAENNHNPITYHQDRLHHTN